VGSGFEALAPHQPHLRKRHLLILFHCLPTPASGQSITQSDCQPEPLEPALPNRRWWEWVPWAVPQKCRSIWFSAQLIRPRPQAGCGPARPLTPAEGGSPRSPGGSRGPRAPLHLPQTAGLLFWFSAHAGNPHAAAALTALAPVPHRPAAGVAGEGQVPGRDVRRGYRGWHESTLLSRQPRQDHECRQLPARLVNERGRCVPHAMDIRGQGGKKPEWPRLPSPAHMPLTRQDGQEHPERPESLPQPLRHPHVTLWMPRQRLVLHRHWPGDVCTRCLPGSSR
jgi:hypothetical protein